jgi:hypothetical protein
MNVRLLILTILPKLSAVGKIQKWRMTKSKIKEIQNHQQTQVLWEEGKMISKEM